MDIVGIPTTNFAKFFQDMDTLDDENKVLNVGNVNLGAEPLKVNLMPYFTGPHPDSRRVEDGIFWRWAETTQLDYNWLLAVERFLRATLREYHLPLGEMSTLQCLWIYIRLTFEDEEVLAALHSAAAQGRIPSNTYGVLLECRVRFEKDWVLKEGFIQCLRY